MPIEWIKALMGGVLIAVSVTLFLAFNGRVTGISGIVYGLFNSSVKESKVWRWMFIAGLILAGLFMSMIEGPGRAFLNTYEVSYLQLILAGLLVGFGTVLGSGCTSGHGVCGISRLSIRSILATLVFIATGVLTVALLRALGVVV